MRLHVNKLKNWHSYRIQEKMKIMDIKLKIRQQKNKNSSLFMMKKKGYELLEGMHPGNSPGKTNTEK